MNAINLTHLKEKLATADAFTPEERDYILDALNELEAFKMLFDMQRKADQRAVKRWQEAHPNRKRVWPDRADMVVWLMEQLEGPWNA